MCRPKFLFSAALVLSSALLVSDTEAATVVFSDKALFLSNLAAGSYEEAFTGGAGLSQIQSFSGGSPAVFTYEVTTVPSTATSVYRSADLISAGSSTAVLRVTMTSGNVYGVGGNFFKTDDLDAFVSGQSFTITLNDGTVQTVTSTSVNDFVGFVSDEPITTLSISATALPSIYSSMDNLVVGTPVPEPGLTALLAAGCFLTLRRRKTVTS